MGYERRTIITREAHSTSQYRYSVCMKCSAWVQNEEIHDKWHANLERTSDMAERSAAWTIPLA